MTLIVKRTLQPWGGEPIGGLRHPRNIERLWTAEELAAVGLAVAVPFDAPEGKRIVGAPTYELDGGIVKTVYAVEDIPPPSSITPLQARKALRAAGIKAQVDVYIATLTEAEREEWEFAAVVMRDNAIIRTGATALGLSDAELDDLFRRGATL